jgi:hypothetical protein
MRSCDPQSNVMAWKANLCSTGFDSFGGDGLCLAPSFPSPRRLSLPVSIPRLFHSRALCLTRRTLNQIRSFHLPPSRLALRLQALGLLPIIANAATLAAQGGEGGVQARMAKSAAWRPRDARRSWAKGGCRPQCP